MGLTQALNGKQPEESSEENQPSTFQSKPNLNLRKWKLEGPRCRAYPRQ